MRLRFIKTAQGLGVNLDEIADLTKLDDGTHCQQAQAIAVRKLEGVRAHLRDLQSIEKVLLRLVPQCETRRGAIRCPLIESLIRDSARDTSG